MKVYQIMTRNPICTEATDFANEALQLMSSYELSELPVVEADKVVGAVRENKLMAKVIQNREVMTSAISEVMEEPMPVLDANEDIQSGIAKLKEHPAIVVKEFGRLIGVLSRHDVLGYL